MKKALFISPMLPKPEDDGGKVRIRNFLNCLARDYEVTALFLMQPSTPGIVVQQNKEYFKRLNISYELVEHEEIPGYKHNRFMPNIICPAFSTVLINKTKEFIDNNNYEIIFIDTIWISYLTDYLNHPNIQLNLHNIEARIIQRMAKNCSNLKLKLARYYEIVKLYLYEKRILKNIRKFYVCSETDRDYYKNKLKIKTEIEAVPNTMDVSEFPYKPDVSSSGNILFIGLLTYKPNIESLFYFIEDIYPLVLEKIPEAALHIVGKSDDAIKGKIKTFKYNVNYHGYVDDVAEYFYNSTILITPFLSGSGTRFKIIEAFARGLPVVSTAIGAEGLNTEHGKDIYIADTAESFAEGCIELLTDKSLHQSFADNARKTAERFYDTNQVFSNLQIT